jgi:DNA invertase Pin-like site-specific DNA recombinase
MRGREYLRVSAAKGHKRGASVGQQHQENERAAATHGFELAEPYREPEAVSASRYSRKAREAYLQLIEDIETGAFGADLLVMWESSRGSRRTGEWVDLIDICAAKAIRIFVTTHGRMYDPRNARDRRSLLEDAIDSEYESAKISARVTRGLAANAAAGKPHGRTPYGYRRIYDERSGALIRQEPDPATAPNVVELFDRVRLGDSIKSIQRDWDSRGIRNASGRPFGDAHLRGLLDQRAYIGEREHNGTIYEASWEPLISRHLWQAVRAIVSAPGRVTNRPARARYHVSMIARCGVCGGPLTGHTNVDRRHRYGPIYRCRDQHVIVSMADLDDLVMDVAAAYLSQPAVRAELSSAVSESPRLNAARNSLADIEIELGDLYARVAAGELSAGALASIEPGLLNRQQAAQQTIDDLQTPAELAGILETPEGTRRHALEAMSVERLRKVYGLLFLPSKLGVPHVNRSERRGPKQPPVEHRVEWRKGD